MSTITNITNGSVQADGVFDTANGWIDQAMVIAIGVVGLIGIGIVIASAVAGKGRIPAIIAGIIAGGLFVWGGVAGVFWVKGQMEATVNDTAAPAIVQILDEHIA